MRRSDLGGDWRGSQSSLRSGDRDIDHAYLKRRTTVHDMNESFNSEFYPRDAEVQLLYYYRSIYMIRKSPFKVVFGYYFWTTYIWIKKLFWGQLGYKEHIFGKFQLNWTFLSKVMRF